MTPSVKPDIAAFVQLTEQEYVDFCDLIICGSMMAEYLIAAKYIRTNIREHAHYWQELAGKFKPLLSKILSSPSSYG